MAKIAIIIHYIGKLPEFFGLFAHSCSYNPNIDFLVITDAKKPEQLPSNIKFIELNLTDFKKLVEAKTEIISKVNTGYKLCDFRPFYGLLFKEYIEGYDFWGHCDMDLILSNVFNFLPKEAMESDIVSMKKEWISGSFALYRNIEAVNSLYLQSKDWKQILEDEKYYRFDECGTMMEGEAMAYHYIQNGKPILGLDSEVESITHIVEKIKVKILDLPIRIYQKTCIKESLSPDMLLKYDKGEITMVESATKNHPIGSKYLHYHYITEKKNLWFRFPNWAQIPDVFYIDDTGFYREEELPKRAQIRSKRKMEGNLKYWTRVFPKKVFKKLLGK